MPPRDRRRLIASSAPRPIADVVAWRRRALEQQLPDARFPGGVVAPSLVGLVGHLIIAAVCAILFAATSGTRVPQAVVDSQSDLVRQVVHTAEVVIDQNAETLAHVVRQAGSRADRTPRSVAQAVANDGSGWDGAVVVETVSRKALASSGGEFVLPTTLDLSQRSVIGRFVNGQPQLMTISPIDAHRTVVTASTPRFKSLRLNPQSQHTILLGTAFGETIPLQGTNHIDQADQAQISRVLAQAAADAKTVSLGAGAGPDGRALLVTGRPIGETGLVVISAVRAELLDGGRPMQGLAAASLLVLAAVSAAVIGYVYLVRPMRQLLDQAIADASGEPGRRGSIRRPRELSRISAALAREAPRRYGMPVMAGLWVGCLLVMTVSAGLAIHYGRQSVTVPTQVISDEAARIDATGYVVGNSLNLGLERVNEVMAQLGKLTPGSARPVFQRTLRNERRFRGLYLVNDAGKTILAVGREPLRQPMPLPGEGGIRLDMTAGRLPVIYAYKAEIGVGGLVAEFDIEYLISLLRQMDGRVRILDSELRTIMDTEGFIAFQQLSNDALQGAAIASLAGETSSQVLHAGGSEIGGKRLVASSSIADPDTVAHLEWVVVSERAVTMLQLPATMRYRAVVLAAGAAGALALFTLGWQYFMLVRPLRALAEEAEAIQAGNCGRPVPLRRHDEVGAVAACLELCRQVEKYGQSRFGGAMRLRGEGEDITAVIPRVNAQRRRLTATKDR